MTARPTAGYVVGSVFLLQAVSLAVALLVGAAPAVTVVGLLVAVVIAVAYLASSFRLATRQQPA